MVAFGKIKVLKMLHELKVSMKMTVKRWENIEGSYSKEPALRETEILGANQLVPVDVKSIALAEKYAKDSKTKDEAAKATAACKPVHSGRRYQAGGGYFCVTVTAKSK